MVTWVDKIAFVGMTAETVPKESRLDACYRHKVKVRIPGRVCSFGYGNTFEKAIESAAVRMSICWGSVERKITEREWARIAHT